MGAGARRQWLPWGRLAATRAKTNDFTGATLPDEDDQCAQGAKAAAHKSPLERALRRLQSSVTSKQRLRGACPLRRRALQITTTAGPQDTVDGGQVGEVRPWARMRDAGSTTGAMLVMKPGRWRRSSRWLAAADYNKRRRFRGTDQTSRAMDPLGWRGPSVRSFKVYTYAAGGFAGRESSRRPRCSTTRSGPSSADTPFSDWDGKHEGYITLRNRPRRVRANLPALWTYRNEGGDRVVSFMHKPRGVTAQIEETPMAWRTTLGPRRALDVRNTPRPLIRPLTNGWLPDQPARGVLRVTDASGKMLEAFRSRRRPCAGDQPRPRLCD